MKEISKDTENKDKKPKLSSKVDQAGNYVFDENKVNSLLMWVINKTQKDQKDKEQDQTNSDV